MLSVLGFFCPIVSLLLLGKKVEGSGSRVEGSKFRILDFGSRFLARVSDFGFRV